MAGGILLSGLAAAALLAAGCGHSQGQTSDAGAATDGAGDVSIRDAPIDRPGVASSDAPADDGWSDAPPDAPPPPGFISCGRAICDPTSQYCFHITGGLTGESYTCAAIPAGCAGQAADCACLFPDGGPPFCPCKAVTGTDTAGLQLDCPGPVG